MPYNKKQLAMLVFRKIYHEIDFVLVALADLKNLIFCGAMASIMLTDLCELHPALVSLSSGGTSSQLPDPKAEVEISGHLSMAINLTGKESRGVTLELGLRCHLTVWPQ